MQLDNLGVIERKVLGALLVLTDASNNNTVKATHQDIADLINYKTGGGALSFALKILERDNYIVSLDRSTYKLLI